MATQRAEQQPVMAGVTLRPWSADDLPLMERLLGEPGMTVHLGGPESPERIRRRHQRYMGVGDTSKGSMFVVAVGPDGSPAGSVGYWEHEWQGETVWETGWSVLPEFQGRGIATRATSLVVAKAAAERLHGSVHAFPSIANGASNAVCRKAGFTLLGEVDFEYPKGHPMRCNDWAIDLAATD
jgi:RimJ/RimL family protein N-acetyltransferase